MKRLAIFLAVLLLGSACARREPEWTEYHEKGVSSSNVSSEVQKTTPKKLEKDVKNILTVQLQNEVRTIPVLRAEDMESYMELFSEVELLSWSGSVPAENGKKIIYTLKTGGENEIVTLHFLDGQILCEYVSESEMEMKYDLVEIPSQRVDFERDWYEVAGFYRECAEYESAQTRPTRLAGEGLDGYLKNLSQETVAPGYRISDFSVRHMKALEKCREGMLLEARFDVKAAGDSFAGIPAGEDGWVRDLCWQLWIRKSSGPRYVIEELGETDVGESVDWKADLRYAREHMPDDFQLYTLFGDSDALSDAPAPADLSHSNVYQGENCVELVDFATGKITHRLSYPEGFADYLGLWEGTLIFGNGREAAAFDGTLQELWRVEVADYEVLTGQAVINWDTLQAYDTDDRGIRAQDLITGETRLLAPHINDSQKDDMEVSLEANLYSHLWLKDHGRILLAKQIGYEWLWGYTCFNLVDETHWEIPMRSDLYTYSAILENYMFSFEPYGEVQYGSIYDIWTGASRQIEISRLKEDGIFYTSWGGAAAYGDNVYVFLQEGEVWNLVRLSLQNGELTDCGITIEGVSPNRIMISEDGWLLVWLEEDGQELCYGAVRLPAVSETAESL